MLDIYEMKIFLTAAETGSFSEAGRRLQLSQPAISQQIRALETRLDIQLFHRAGRHIQLTEMGQTLIPLARNLVNHASDVQDTIQALKGDVVGMLKLACSTSAGKYILPKLIAGFIDRYPAVQVVCRVGTRGSALEMLVKGEAQIAITSLEDISRDLEYRQFIRDGVILIAPPGHPWTRRRSITVPELRQGRFIRRETDSGTQQTVIRGLIEQDLSAGELNTVMVLGNSEAVCVAVEEGIGVAFVSKRAATAGIASGRLIQVPVEGLHLAQQLHMVRQANTLMTNAPAAFWDFVYSEENRHLLEQE